LTVSEVDLLSVCLVHKRFAAGDTIITAGDPADELYFLVRGTVSVLMTTAGGGLRRLATFSPGMTFGEMAVIDRAPRSATIVADTEVECEQLSLEALDGLRQSAPEVCIKLLTNLSRTLSQKLRKANRELSVLD
jgi:glutaminase